MDPFSVFVGMLLGGFTVWFVTRSIIASYKAAIEQWKLVVEDYKKVVDAERQRASR